MAEQNNTASSKKETVVAVAAVATVVGASLIAGLTAYAIVQKRTSDDLKLWLRCYDAVNAETGTPFSKVTETYYAAIGHTHY